MSKEEVHAMAENSKESNFVSMKAAVEFLNVLNQYCYNDDLICTYEFNDYTPQEGDRIAIFKLGWNFVKDYITKTIDNLYAEKIITNTLQTLQFKNEGEDDNFNKIDKEIAKMHEMLEIDITMSQVVEPAELTDEDSADEDGGSLVDNLSANQLRTAADISIYQQDNTDDDEIISKL
ncbi:hypothetical protein JTB14_036305 [Gonioctena quinquepunctata]|nr:hypothetical protein JTB14_036305 [Gonioctena quinquepunctata]